MKKFHRIIAAVDFTPFCRAALQEAARRAVLDGAQLVAVHVMEEPLMQQLKKALNTDAATVRQEWTAKLQQFVTESDVTEVKSEVRVGHPFLELVQACETHHADLLVMGAKGSRDEPGRIGAIAAKCVRKAPVDVLIVRRAIHGPFTHVLACVDFSENSAKAVQFALHVAEQDGATVDCVHVSQSSTTLALDYGGFASPLPSVESDEETVKAWQAELDTFLEPLTRNAAAAKVRALVVDSPVVRDTLIDQVTRSHADLVVLGTRGKSGLRELLIGTTAERILQAAACSILAVKPDDFIVPTLG